MIDGGRYLIVELAPPDDEGGAARSRKRSAGGSAILPQPQAEFRLSVEQIRAFEGSLLDQLTEENGDGSAGLALREVGDNTSAVRIPPRDPALFGFAMEVYRLGLEPALRSARPAGYSLAQLARELEYWQLASPQQVHDPLLSVVALGSGSAADVTEALACMREAHAERLWGQMRRGIRAQVASVLPALARYTEAFWAFALVADPQQGQQGQQQGQQRQQGQQQGQQWLLDAHVVQPGPSASSTSLVEALYAGARCEAEFRRRMTAASAASTPMASCRGSAPGPAAPLLDIMDSVQLVEPGSTLVADLRAMAIRDGYEELGVVSFGRLNRAGTTWLATSAHISLVYVKSRLQPLLPDA